MICLNVHGVVSLVIYMTKLIYPSPKICFFSFLAKAPDAQIIYSEVANTIGKTALQFALVGGLFTAGSQVSAMFRQTNDSANYGVGGACVGAYSGLRSGGGRLHMVVVKAIAFGVFGTAVATIARSKSNPVGSAHVSHILSMRFPTALNASSVADKSSH